MNKLIFTNPGSDEAVAKSCLCPRMDNAYGKGYMGGVTPHFFLRSVVRIAFSRIVRNG